MSRKKCYECGGVRPWGTCNADGKMNGECINCGRLPKPPTPPADLKERIKECIGTGVEVTPAYLKNLEDKLTGLLKELYPEPSVEVHPPAPGELEQGFIRVTVSVPKWMVERAANASRRS